MSSPVVVDGKVYAGGWDGYVYALDAETGDVMWRFQAGGQLGDPPPAVADGVVYADDFGKLSALDTETGHVIWQSEGYGPVVTIVNGQLYVTSGDELCTVNADTGEEAWCFQADSLLESPPVVVGSVVYVLSEDGYVYAIGGAEAAEPTIVITLATPTPYPYVDPGPDVCGVNPDPALPSLLQVQEPQPGQRVGNPFQVRGWGSEIRLEQSGVIVALVDVNGEPIQDKDVPPESRAGRIVPAGLKVTDATAPFTTDILIQGLSEATSFCVWVFLETSVDGIPINVVQVPVVVVP